jgi:hypothetical protein
VREGMGDQARDRKQEEEESESGTRTGGGGEVPPVGGLIRKDEQRKGNQEYHQEEGIDQEQGQHHQHNLQGGQDQHHHQQGQQEGDINSQGARKERDTQVWVKGSTEEDNRRYRELMDYMEEKRLEARELLKAENDRKARAKKKESSWALLRLSMAYLREHEEGWRVRKMKEFDRIREEEKEDRLAIVREKKRKYGIKRISKEENMRLKKRTEERLEIASAKGNLWKKIREKGQELAETGEDAEAWEGLRTSVMELEEDGSWRDIGEEASNLTKMTIRGETEGLSQGGQVGRGDKVHGGVDGQEREGETDRLGQGGQVLREDEVPGGAAGQDREGGMDGLGQGGHVQRGGEIHGGGDGQEREGGLDQKELPGLILDEHGQGGQAQRGDKVHGGADGQDREGETDGLGQGGQVLREDKAHGGADGLDREGGLDALGQGGHVQRGGEIHGGGDDELGQGGQVQGGEEVHGQDEKGGTDALCQGGQVQREEEIHGGGDGQEREGGYGRTLKTIGKKHTSSEMFTLKYNKQTTKVKSLVADIEDRSQGRQSLCKSGQPDHQSDHMGTRIGGRWDGRRLRTAARGTGTEVKKGGTWGKTCPLDIPDFSAPGSEDEFLGAEVRRPVSSVMVHQPPAIGPTILPFCNETPGVSAAPSSSSPARRTKTPSSSSRSKKKKKKIRKEEIESSSPKNKVRKKILLIETLKGRKKEAKFTSELFLETDRKRKEEKLREEEKKEEKGKGYRHLVFGTSVKATKDAYLQGLGPQTGPGSAPASSSSKSLDSSRRRSSSAAGSAKGRGLQAWQVQE